MKSLLLLPFVAVALVVLIPLFILLGLIGATVFAPVFASVGVSSLPSKFYDYAK